MKLPPFVASARKHVASAFENDRVRSLLLAAGIFAFLASEKLPFTTDSYGPLPDGGYYMNIAQHVRDGDGLVSDLSLAHKGAPFLPHPTDMYPLWPLFYGYVSRAAPIEPTGHWLPTFLYFVSLVVGFLWAQKLFGRNLLPSTVPGFNAGHLFVLMLGLNGEFFRYTSYPYTEGLTYTVVLLALWRMNRLWARPGIVSGLELGVWLGLATLARKQLFLMTLAALPVLAGALAFAAERRKAFASMTAGAAVGFAAVAGPHYWYMSSILPDMSPAKFLRWDQNQHTNALTRLRTLREAKTVGAYLRDRWQGVPVAFGTSASSYTAQYYTFQYAVPAAALPAAVLAVRRLRRGVLDTVRSLFAPETCAYTYLTIFAIGGFLSIHTIHMHPDASGEWMFGGRHALTCIFLILLANVLLFQSGRFPWAPIAAFLLCTSIYLGGARINEWEKTLVGDENPRPGAFTEWVNAEKASRGKLVIALRQPQTLAHFTPGVGYHWYGDYTPFRDICAMTSKLGVDYVVITNRARWKSDRGFKDAFELAHQIGKTEVYRPIHGGKCAAASR